MHTYKGYLIFPGLIGDWFAKKDGFVIYCGRSVAMVHAAVDAAVQS